MEKEKVIALLEEVLDENYNEGLEIIIKDNSMIEVDGKVYKVLSDEEADEEFTSYQENLIDDLGINSFSDFGQKYILENFTDTEWFDEARKESYESYIEDIKQESASDTEKFSSRLEEELYEADCENEEEYLERLCDDEGSVTWFKFNFGDDDFKAVVKENDLVNWEGVIEWVKEVDGRGCLAYYDGEELELENDYYAYRVE